MTEHRTWGDGVHVNALTRVHVIDDVEYTQQPHFIVCACGERMEDSAYGALAAQWVKHGGKSLQLKGVKDRTSPGTLTAPEDLWMAWSAIARQASTCTCDLHYGKTGPLPVADPSCPNFTLGDDRV